MTQEKATAEVKLDKATHRPWQIHRNEHGVRYEVGPVINTFFTCAYVSGFYSEEAKANAELIVTAVNERDALLSEVAQLKSALSDYVKFSDEAALMLDQDRDAKCLKLLIAMACRAPKYRADVDNARALLGKER